MVSKGLAMPVSIYWLLAPLSLVIGGLALTNHYRPITLEKWDVGVVFLWLISAALYWWIEILIKMALWQGYMTSADAPAAAQAYRNEPKKYDNLNTATLNSVTPLVKIDVMGIKIKRCCRTLINQRESGFKIDLREQTWLSQFGGRDNFVHFRDVIMSRAFAKESERKNSPFVVIDWTEVQRGASGQIKY